MESASPSQSDEMRALRDRAGLTQEEASEKLDMKTRTYGAYERGERSISYEQMRKVRRVLGGQIEPVPNTRHIGDVLQYPVANDGGESSTVFIDPNIINVEGSMPDPSEAKAYRVNSRWMGPWMSSDMALVREKRRIDGPGRYVVEWSQGSDKIVIEAWRYGEEKVCVRTHAPRKETIFEEVEHHDNYTLFRREDGTEIRGRVIGQVVFPSDDVQLMTEGMADTAARIVNGSSE